MPLEVCCHTNDVMTAQTARSGTAGHDVANVIVSVAVAEALRPRNHSSGNFKINFQGLLLRCLQKDYSPPEILQKFYKKTNPVPT